MRAIFLVDHANVPFSKVRVTDIVRAWIDTWPDKLAPTLYVDFRAYGGWFDGTAATTDRFRAAEFYQQECTTLFGHAGRLVRLAFAFADKLLVRDGVESRPHMPFITHTVAVRNSPMYLQRHPNVTPCAEANCQLPAVKRWVKKQRACGLVGCPHAFDEYFGRTEQKQVDVHLAVDLLQLSATRHYEHVIVVSEDWDLLPAILAATRNAPGVYWSVVRFRPGSTYLDISLQDRGLRFVGCTAGEGL